MTTYTMAVIQQFAVKHHCDYLYSCRGNSVSIIFKGAENTTPFIQIDYDYADYKSTRRTSLTVEGREDPWGTGELFSDDVTLISYFMSLPDNEVGITKPRKGEAQEDIDEDD